MRHFLLICLLLCLTIPLHAQDNPTPYDIALQRIHEASISGTTELGLAWLHLTELPPEVWELTNLRSLDLRRNQLTSLPSEIGQLTNLQRLHLAGNELTSLPPEVWELINLQELWLSDNELANLPPEIGQLTNLQELWLSDNELTRLPPEIGQLTNLQELWLLNNQIRHLPSELGNLTNMTCAECRLVLQGNPLISPPPEVVNRGTSDVLNYLRNPAWYHVQRLTLLAASGVGLLAMLLLGMRYRQPQRKEKLKRG